MCDFLSFFVSTNGKKVAAGDLRSHSASATLLGIKTESPRCPWREAEWTGEGGDSLTVRVAPYDEHNERWLRAAILAKYPTRAALLEKLIIPPGVQTLYLSGATIPEKLIIPPGVRLIGWQRPAKRRKAKASE